MLTCGDGYLHMEELVFLYHMMHAIGGSNALKESGHPSLLPKHNRWTCHKSGELNQGSHQVVAKEQIHMKEIC